MLERLPLLRSGGLLPGFQDIDPFTDNFLSKWMRDFDGSRFPSVDIKETDKTVVVEAELPGMEIKDIDISLENNSLVIKGEKKRATEQKGENYHRVERSYGSFYRTVALPCRVDRNGVKASYKHGILSVTLSKAETERAERIKIES
jgi:HSP20 family protein